MALFYIFINRKSFCIINVVYLAIYLLNIILIYYYFKNVYIS